MFYIRRAMAYLGSLLLVWAGVADSKQVQPPDTIQDKDNPSAGETDHLPSRVPSLPDGFYVGQHVNSGPNRLQELAASNMLGGGGGGAMVHVNSGPTTHTNKPGHANFSMKLLQTKTLTPLQIRTLTNKLSGGASPAAHVNSGPTNHSNVPGHANFTMTLRDAGLQKKKLNTRQIRMLQNRLGAKIMGAKTMTRGGSQAHVNSGPTTHTNKPGHANFSMTLRESKLNPQQLNMMTRRFKASVSGSAAHANSGPTTHSNIGNHYNFSAKFKNKTLKLNTLKINSIKKQLEGR